MTTKTYRNSPDQLLRCNWPKGFTKYRFFNPESENKPYIESLRETYEEEDEECEDDVSDSSEDGEDEDGVEDEDEDEDGEDEDEDDVKAQRGKCKNPNFYGKDAKDAEPCNLHKNVREFMKGMYKDENMLQYGDQVNYVADFCEAACDRDFEPGTVGKKNLVALVYDRSRSGTTPTKEGKRSRSGVPLTLERLRTVLTEPRFRIKPDSESNRNDATMPREKRRLDAEIRVIFITDLDAFTIEVLAATASRSQARALKDFFYKYLTSKTSIGVTISRQGFPVFSLDFNIPYYALRKGREPAKDSRKKPSGEPLRASSVLPLLPQLMNGAPPMNRQYLYEGQISVTITGINDRVWTAYGVVDTYFHSKKNRNRESIRDYHKWNEDLVEFDPLSAGQISTSLTPRDYFARTFAVRINEVLKEWDGIFKEIDKSVKQYVPQYKAGVTVLYGEADFQMSRARTSDVFQLSSSNPRGKQVRDCSEWNREMVKILNILVPGLSDTVEAWKEFKENEIGYFLTNPDSPAVFASITNSFTDIENKFSGLRSILRKLGELKQELCKENPQGLNAHLIIRNSEATLFQANIAIIVLLFYPLSIASNLFSTQGVFPFSPGPAQFGLVVLVVTVLIVAIFAILFDWVSWSWLQLSISSVIAELNFWKIKSKLQTEKETVKEDPNDQLTREETFDSNTLSYRKDGFCRGPELHWKIDIEKGLAKEVANITEKDIADQEVF